jgi:hypothetical protein
MNTNLLRTLLFAAISSIAMADDIPAGTHLLLSTENSISTSTARIGDAVHFRTVTPISVGGKIVVPVGSYAQGVVTRTKRSGRVHGQAQFEIQVVRLLLASGQVLNVSSRSASIAPDEGFRSAPQNDRVRPEVFAAAFPIALLAGAGLGSQVGGENGAETGAYIGLAAAVALPIVVAILHRGREVELRPGTAVDVVFDQPASLN